MTGVVRQKCPECTHIVCHWLKPGIYEGNFRCEYCDALVEFEPADVRMEDRDFRAPEARKDDSGKPRWSLLPWKALGSVVGVLEYGAKKYAPEAWRNVPGGKARYREALLRHVIAYTRGEDLDPESGLPHLAHVVCNALFLLEL
jgi:hypothetical protein